MHANAPLTPEGRLRLCRRIAAGSSITATAGLELPSVDGRRDRIASPDEADRLVAALPFPDRAIWATALSAGLRCGEPQALDWSSVDLASGLIRVERSSDPGAHQYIEPKPRAGLRRVPMPAVLRDVLVEHRMNGTGEGLMFGRPDGRPFSGSAIRRRAQRFWATAGLDPMGLHEARHTCASTWIAAGVNAKALSTYLGHANISVTFDRYGHLMRGGEDAALALIDALYASATATRTDTRTPEPA